MEDNLEKGAKYYEKAIALDPTIPKTNLRLAAIYFDMDSLIRFIVGDAYALESTASNESVRRVLSNARRVVKDRGRKSLIFSTLEDLPEFVKIGIDIIFVPEQDLNEARIVAAKTEREMLLELWRERKNS